MNVRFDNPKTWKTANGRVIAIDEMETAHLMNTLRMFATKPTIVLSMIVADIDKTREENYHSGPWTPNTEESVSFKKMSMYTVTSMTEEQLVEYALTSALGRSMIGELTFRGLNVDNLLMMWKAEEEFNEE